MNSIFFYQNSETTHPEGEGLQGMRIAIQPNISVTGWPTDAGSKALSGFKALEDATIVQRLRQAGACLCGSTRMSEFGLGLDNSQAGRAIEQQAADAELIIDLMGESRLAAARTGVCGLKPSYGLVSRYGLVGLIPSMECCGILSGSISRIRSILKVSAGKDERDFSLPDESIQDFTAPPIDPSAINVGVIKESIDTLSEEESRSFRLSLEELKRSGSGIREISMQSFSDFSLVHKIVGSVEASSCAGRYDSYATGSVTGARNRNEMYISSRGAAFGTLLKSYLFQGAFFQFENYEAYENACRIRARLLKEMAEIIAQVDFLVLPAGGGKPCEGPPSLSGLYAQFALTLFANVTGQPALYLPGPDKQSGYQLTGQRLSDARLLALGEFLLNKRQGGN